MPESTSKNGKWLAPPDAALPPSTRCDPAGSRALGAEGALLRCKGLYAPHLTT